MGRCLPLPPPHLHIRHCHPYIFSLVLKFNKLLFRFVNCDLCRRTVPPEEGNTLLAESSVLLGIHVHDEVQ
jgi:hypothetical protein